MVVMANEKGCNALRKLYPDAQCAWTSYLDGAPGAAKWGFKRGTVYWVWIMRWHVRGGQWEEGGVTVLKGGAPFVGLGRRFRLTVCTRVLKPIENLSRSFPLPPFLFFSLSAAGGGRAGGPRL